MPSEDRQLCEDSVLRKSTTNSTMSSSISTHSANMTSRQSDENISSSAVRTVKANGTREGHRVTFAESHTEHETISNTDDTSAISDRKEYTQTTTISNNIVISSHADGSYLEYQPQSSQLSQQQRSTHSPTTNQPPPQMAPLTPIIKLQRSASTESHENPFLADGELSKKAEYIITHSTISRSEIKIEDPDLAKKRQQQESQPVVEESVKKSDAGGALQSERPNDINVSSDQNGKIDEQPVTPSGVEVVEKANAKQAEPQKAEQVKLKDDKKCKCCVIM